MIKVKVCGMRNLVSIQAVADSDPDFLGYIFYEASKRYVGDNPDKLLFKAVKPGIRKVGVFVNADIQRVINLSNRFELDLVQLHGSESPAYCREVKSAGIPVIKAFGVDDQFKFDSLIPYLKVCDYFLFDTKSEQHGGTGQKFNWERINGYSYDVPFFLSGGIGPNDFAVVNEITHPAFFAVDINSRFETEPGTKNILQVKTFINKIKQL